jgi:hypothetical protein
MAIGIGLESEQTGDTHELEERVLDYQRLKKMGDELICNLEARTCPTNERKSSP